MEIPKPKRKIVIISDTPPTDRDDWQYYCWIDTTTRQIKEFEGGTWVSKVSFADTLPSGLTTVIKHGNKDMTFTNGILTSYQ